MSVDYRIEIFRKSDDKKIGEFLCNWLKSLFRCDLQDYRDFERFEYSDLKNKEDQLRSEIETRISEIFTKKMMIPMCQNPDVKSSLEEDILCQKEIINDLDEARNATFITMGRIGLIVEDNIRYEKSEDNSDEITMAYAYNAKDLNAENDMKYLWIDDVYCKLHAE